MSLNPVVATVVWSDDFETGMDGWTVGAGYWRVTDGELEAYYVDEQSFPARIWHDSSVVEGTWSFEFTPGNEINFLFMTNGTDVTVTYDGYGVRVINDYITLLKINDGSTNGMTMATIDEMGSWVRIEITRNASTGQIHVYVNATSSEAVPNLSYVDTDYNYSDVFLIAHNKNGFRFDNIVVNDEILITPILSTTITSGPINTTTTTTTTTPTLNGNGFDPTTMLIIAGGGIAGLSAAWKLKKSGYDDFLLLEMEEPFQVPYPKLGWNWHLSVS